MCAVGCDWLTQNNFFSNLLHGDSNSDKKMILCSTVTFYLANNSKIIQWIFTRTFLHIHMYVFISRVRYNCSY